MNREIYLREKGIKVTKSRMLILEIISKSSEAVDANEILKICKEQNFNVNLSTIYRCLELFEQKGIIEKFDIGEGKYEFRLKENGHKHLLECSLCNKTIEVDCPMHQVEQLIKSKTGFVILEHDLKMKAVCEECIKSKHS